jgi:hypothetical protein
MKRFAGLCLVALSLSLASAPASARDGENAAAAALGLVGGLAIGAAIASQPAPVVVRRAAPVVVEEVYEEPVCVIKRRRYVDEFGDVVVRRVRVCD